MMDVGASRWLVKTAHKHLWRVSTFYDVTDLIQDGWMCYMRVRRKYPDVSHPPHIMRLFQVTFLNHINDLSKMQSRMQALIDYSVDLDTAELYQRPEMAEQGDAYFIPQSAPWYVHAFLRLLCSPYGPEALRSRHRVRISAIPVELPSGRVKVGFSSIRDMTHDKLCRLIGADPDQTPVLPDALEDYFSTV